MTNRNEISNEGDFQPGTPQPDLNISSVETPKQVIDILNTTTQFEKRIQELKLQYAHFKDGNIPQSLHQEMKNPSFGKAVNEYVQAQLFPYDKKGVLDSPSEEAFSVLSFCLFLLGRGEFYNIYENLETFHPVHFLSLVTDIQKKLYDIKDQPDIDSHPDVQRFYNFFETLNKIWILSEIVQNSHVKEGGIILLNSILNTDLLKFADTRVAQKQKYFRGRMYLNFSQVFLSDSFASMDSSKDADMQILHNQIKGFQACKESHFGGDMSEEISTRQVFLGNASTHVLKMVNELKGLYFSPEGYEELNEGTGYQVFITTLLESKIIPRSPRNLEDLEQMLLDNYLFVYDFSGIHGDLHSVIIDFVQTQNVDNYKIETVYNIVHLGNELSLDEKMALIRRVIEDKVSYKNSILEYFKLKTISSILDQIAQDEDVESFEKINAYVEWISFVNEYIDLNKRASHLMKTFGDLKVKMAFILSRFYKHQVIISQSEFLLIEGMAIQGKNIFDVDYTCESDHIVEQILINIGYAQSLESGFPTENIPHSVFRSIGLSGMEKTIDFKLAEKKLNAGDALVKLFAETAVGEFQHERDINQRACSVISGQLFFDIAHTFIVHKDDDTGHNEKYFAKGQDTYEVELTSGYKLVFIYPSILKEVFMNIYNKNSDYIKQNLAGIISNYIKKKERLIDTQTGLPNDFKLREDLAHIPLGRKLLVIRVQNMGNFNVNSGFLFGTQYLKELGKLLQKEFSQKGGKYSGVYKMSNGTYFGLVLDDEKFNKFENRAKSLSVSIDNLTFPVDLKVGYISLTPENIESDVIHKAVSALYYKEDRVNRFVEYSKEKSDKAKDSTMMEYRRKLDDLEENARVFVQPIVDFRGDVQKYEILMRVYNPESGQLESPFHYLQAAEYFDMNAQVDTIMMNKTFTGLEKAQNVYPISLNLTSDFLSDKDKIESLIGLWNIMKKNREEAGKSLLENSYLTIEVLESDWGDNKEKIIDQLIILKEKGFKIALDDYGAASSNPHRLNELLQYKVVDYVKIDGDLIRAFLKINKEGKKGPMYTEEELESRSFLAEADIRSVAEKSKIMGFIIVAEFVEDKRDINTLKRFGIELFQGYGIGEPRDSFEVKKEGE